MKNFLKQISNMQYATRKNKKLPIAYCLMLIAYSLLVFTACDSKTENTDTLPTSGEVGRGLTIELTAEQFKAVGIELGSIEQKNLRTVVKASGYLEVPPQNKASVSTYIGAVVKSISVLEGSFVKQGQTLALLEHPDFIKLQENYITSKNELGLSEKEYFRQKELFEQNAGTGKIFQKAESDYHSAKARVSSLENQLKLLSVNTNELSQGKITSSFALIAPIEGYVGHINANTGAYAEPNKILFEIIDNTKIHCDLLVYEKDLFKVKIGQKVNFILANNPEHQDEHDRETIEGEIFGINKSFENDTKALTVHASIKNEKHELIPGMYVNALIDVDEQTTMVVPIDAVVKSDGKEWIFVVVDSVPFDEGKSIAAFKMTEVITGISDLGYIEIKPLELVSANARIVIKNAFFILSKSKEGEED